MSGAPTRRARAMLEDMGTRLVVSAHRHGNDLDALRAACDAQPDLVEVDVRMFWGRVEARHHKSVGPLPILWDRGERPRVRLRRLRLDDVVRAAPEGTVLHVDLKGFSPRLPGRVQRILGDRPYLVATRSWWLLRSFRSAEHVTVMRSIGAPWQLRWFLRRHPGGVDDAVCIRRDRLTPEVAALLLPRCRALYVWRVDTRAEIDDLVALGVHGVIVDDLVLVRAIAEERGHVRRGDETAERERHADDGVEDVVVRGRHDGDAHERRAEHREHPNGS